MRKDFTYQLCDQSGLQDAHVLYFHRVQSKQYCQMSFTFKRLSLFNNTNSIGNTGMNNWCPWNQIQLLVCYHLHNQLYCNIYAALVLQKAYVPLNFIALISQPSCTISWTIGKHITEQSHLLLFHNALIETTWWNPLSTPSVGPQAPVQLTTQQKQEYFKILASLQTAEW